MKLTKSLLLPYLKRFWLMLLSVVLVGAFGCGILIGLRNAFHNVKNSIYQLKDECGYPDLYAQTIDGVEDKYLSYSINKNKDAIFSHQYYCIVNFKTILFNLHFIILLHILIYYHLT